MRRVLALLIISTLITCESDSITSISIGNLKLTVEDNNGHPISGAEVKIFGQEESSLFTDANGECVFSNLPTQSTVIRIKKSDYKRFYETITLQEGENDKLIKLLPSSEFMEGFESGSLSSIWDRSGAGLWTVINSYSHGGDYSIKSGEIENYQACSISMTYEVEDDYMYLSFWYKINTSYNDHFLEFSINNQTELSISGDADWTLAQFTLPPGIYEFQWTLNKRWTGSNSVGAWIDDIEIVF